MKATHIVNEKDGLDSLWSIAIHYGVDFDRLKNCNPHIINRYALDHPHYEYIYPGDNVYLPYHEKNMRLSAQDFNNSTYLCSQISFIIRVYSICHKQAHIEAHFLKNAEIILDNITIGKTDRTGTFEFKTYMYDELKVTVKKDGYIEKTTSINMNVTNEIQLFFNIDRIRSIVNEKLKVTPRTKWGKLKKNGTQEEHWCYSMIAIHHSGDGFVDTLEEIEDLHIKKYKWAEVGYHYLIDKDGKVYEGTQLGYKGTHILGNNSYKIGILIIGDFNDKGLARGSTSSLTDLNVQLLICIALIRTLKDYFPLTELGGHRDYELGKIKDYHCPGNLLYEKLPRIRTNTELNEPTLPNIEHHKHYNKHT